MTRTNLQKFETRMKCSTAFRLWVEGKDGEGGVMGTLRNFAVREPEMYPTCMLIVILLPDLIYDKELAKEVGDRYGVIIEYPPRKV